MAEELEGPAEELEAPAGLHLAEAFSRRVKRAGEIILQGGP